MKHFYKSISFRFAPLPFDIYRDFLCDWKQYLRTDRILTVNRPFIYFKPFLRALNSFWILDFLISLSASLGRWCFRKKDRKLSNNVHFLSLASSSWCMVRPLRAGILQNAISERKITLVHFCNTIHKLHNYILIFIKIS